MDEERDHKISPDPSFFNKLALVKEVAIFQGLSWLKLNRITRLVELVEIRKGDVICQQVPGGRLLCRHLWTGVLL